MVTPPLCFTLENARHLVETFDKVLNDLENVEPEAEEEQSSVLGYVFHSISSPFESLLTTFVV